MLVWFFVAPATWAADWPNLAVASPTSPGDGSRDAALVVGIEDYASVDDVAGARAVAEEWYRWLAESRRVPLSKLHRLTDRQAVDHKIRAELAAAAAEAQAGGTLWVVFVGHGAPSRDGRDGLLVGADADRSADGIEQRSVLRSELLATADGSAGAPVVVLDACFSGQTATGTALVPGLQPMVPSWAMASGQRSTVLSATSSGEFAGPLPGTGQPAFGYLALGALRGWGDANGDGSVSASEVVEYAKGALRATVTDRTQTPSLLGPDAALAKGKERGPDLVSLALSASPAPAPAPSGNDFAALAAKAKAAEEELRRVEADRQAALDAAAVALRARATADYGAIRDLVSAPTASGKVVLEAWLTQYGSASVTVAGVTQPVAVAEVALVRAAFEKLSTPAVGTGVTSPTVGKLVWVPPGKFTMGSPATESGRDDDEGPHEVRLTQGFHVMEHEVTQAQFSAVMGFNPSATKQQFWNGEEHGSCASFEGVSLVGDSFPVMCVTWDEAVEFARRLSAKEGVTYRLPTEAEWEYASRGGADGQVWSGMGRESDLCRVANVADATAKARWSGWTAATCSDGVAGLAPVGSFLANGWGLHDMSGNVWEWVADWYGAYPIGSMTPEEIDAYINRYRAEDRPKIRTAFEAKRAARHTDPQGATGGSARVLRGGCWGYPPAYARVANRYWFTPGFRFNNLGFRLARVP
jgi:sulfatase modifying factor 1